MMEKSEKMAGLGLDAYFNSSREISEKIAPRPKKTGECDLKERKEKSGRLSNKREFERKYLQELEGSVSQDFIMPPYLLPYANYEPNEEFLIHGGSVLVRTYGLFHGEAFGKKHITRENIDRVLAIHDASHSVAMFLNYLDESESGESHKSEKLDKTIALHSIVPFAFPTSLPYVLYYTQQFNFPLITTEVVQPVRELLGKNLLMKQFKGGQGGRWCTRVYKIEPSRFLFKELGLNGITQLKGITKYQSDRRNRMFCGRAVDLTSSEALLKKIKDKADTPADYEKYFHVFQQLPIFDMTDGEIDELLRIHTIEKNPAEVLCQYQAFDWKANKAVTKCAHGCMLCPFRDEMFYHFLKHKFGGLYQQCDQWRVWASEKRMAEGKSDYYYFWDPIKGKGSKIM